MAHSVQEHAYQTLPDSDSHLPAGPSAEEGIEISEAGQDSTVPQNPSGSEPASPPAPDVSGAAATAADLPLSEVDLQEAWRLVDGHVALLLVTSIVFFAIRRTLSAGVCGCIGIASAIAYLAWRLLRSRGDKSAEALQTAMATFFGIQVVTLGFVGGESGLLWLLGCAKDSKECFHAGFVVNCLYYLLCGTLANITATREDELFPKPKPKPYMEELREHIQEYAPLSAQDHRAQEIRHATQLLEAEESTALYAFRDARSAGDRLRQDEAHRQWQEVGEKLKLLKEDPEQYMQQHGTPSVTV